MGVNKNMSNDLNHATARTLVNATGISHSLAQAIISYRKQKQNNPIGDVHELWKIPGMTAEDFVAINDEFNKTKTQGKQPAAKGNIKTESPRGGNSAAKGGSTTSSTNTMNGPNTARNRRKRARKKRKKIEQQDKMASLSPRRSSLKRNTGSINSKAINQRKGTGNKGLNIDRRIDIPDLYVKNWESPKNTLILFTGGNGPDKILTPVNFVSTRGGNACTVEYLNKSPNRDKKNSKSGGKHANNRKDGRRSQSSSPERQYEQHDSSSRSRSRSRSIKSTSSPPEKRSRSSPTSKSDYSSNNIQIIEWGSNVPHGPGTSTLHSDITLPDNEGWTKNEHESIQNWLAGVRNENIISSSGHDSHRRSTSADSRLSKDENFAQHRLNFDKAKPSTSAERSSPLGQRKPNKFDGNYPTTSREKSRQHGLGIFSTKPLTNALRKSRERGREASVKRQSQKSRHRWQSKVNPGADNLEDERRPIESRLDKPRHNNATEMRRAKKHDLEKQQQRDRFRSRARSRAKSRANPRRKRLMCSVM